MSFILYARIKGTYKTDSISVTGCCTKLSSIFELLEQFERNNPSVTILKHIENNASKPCCVFLDNHDLRIHVEGHLICYCYINYELHDVALKLDHLSSVVQYKKLSDDKWRIKCYDELIIGRVAFGRILSCQCGPNHLSLKQRGARFLNRKRVFLNKKKFNIEDIDVPSLGSLFREDSEYSSFKIRFEQVDLIHNYLSNLLSD